MFSCWVWERSAKYTSIDLVFIWNEEKREKKKKVLVSENKNFCLLNKLFRFRAKHNGESHYKEGCWVCSLLFWRGGSFDLFGIFFSSFVLWVVAVARKSSTDYKEILCNNYLFLIFIINYSTRRFPFESNRLTRVHYFFYFSFIRKNVRSYRICSCLILEGNWSRLFG